MKTFSIVLSTNVFSCIILYLDTLELYYKYFIKYKTDIRIFLKIIFYWDKTMWVDN